MWIATNSAPSTPDWSARKRAARASVGGERRFAQLSRLVSTAKGLRLARSYRTLIFLPTLLSVVIVGFIWQLILSPLWGVGPRLLGAVGLAVTWKGLTWLSRFASSPPRKTDEYTKVYAPPRTEVRGHHG